MDCPWLEGFFLGVAIHIGRLCSCHVKTWAFYYIGQPKHNMKNNCVKNINSNII